MTPYENGAGQSPKVTKELQSVLEARRDLTSQRMAETSIAGDPCSENRICSSKKGNVSESKTSLHSCSCGPDCGPDKCEGRRGTSLVAWDDRRTKIFILLIAAFALWLLIYIPVSVLNMNVEPPSDDHHHHHHHHAP